MITGPFSAGKTTLINIVCGIVTPSAGLLNPNHYLAVAISYLFTHRPEWREDAAIGKTVVSSSLIDRVAKHLGRKLYEVPVGFKWFVSGLLDGSLGFGGEESAGASFLRRDGTVIRRPSIQAHGPGIGHENRSHGIEVTPETCAPEWGGDVRCSLAEIAMLGLGRSLNGSQPSDRAVRPPRSSADRSDASWSRCPG